MADGTVGAIAAAVAVFGGVIGWLASLFGVGRKVGQLESEIERCHERHDGHDTKWDRIENTINEIRSLFYTTEGDTRFLTQSAHDKLQRTCQDNINMQIRHYQESFVALKNEFKEFRTTQEAHTKEILDAIRGLGK